MDHNTIGGGVDKNPLGGNPHCAGTFIMIANLANTYNWRKWLIFCVFGSMQMYIATRGQRSLISHGAVNFRPDERSYRYSKQVDVLGDAVMMD